LTRAILLPAVSIGFLAGSCAVLEDERQLDNTHLAKQKFGLSKGDSWADKASEDLLKVKGKGFSF
jgi:hypothetical protein